MASAHHVEVEAAKFLHKLIQDSTDEPAKLAMKLYVILQHMKLSGKEQSLPYQVISRAMETVISQHGLDIDLLKSSRLPLASGAQTGDPGLVRLKDKDASDSSGPMGGMEMLLRGGSTSASHTASTSKMKDDDQGNSVEKEMIKQEPSVISNRAPGGSGRVESTIHDVHQGPLSQRNAKSFEHESPASLGMEDCRSVISRERHDTTKLDKQVGIGENKKTGSKRKKADSAVATDTHLENPQQFNAPNNGVNMKKSKMMTRGDIQGSSTGKVNEGSSGAFNSYPEDQQASASPGAEASAAVSTREVLDHREGISHSTANTQKGCETLGSLSRESILGKSGSMEISAQRNTKPTDVDRISGPHAPASMPFKEHHLKQLRAQCLVFLAFRNNLPPRKLHLEIALGESYPKEGSNADGIHTGDVSSKEPVNGHEIIRPSTNPTPIRGIEKEMLPPRTPPFSSSTGSPVEIAASSKGLEIAKKIKNKKGPPFDQPSVSEENKHLYAARIKQEPDMRTPETADSQTAMAMQLESSSLVNSGKNDAEHGSGQPAQAFSSVLRASRQLEPQMISLMGSGTLNDASKETQAPTSVDSGHLQDKVSSPFHQLQALKHGDRVGIFQKGKDVEHDYFRHIVKPPPGDISMYSRHLGHIEKFPAILPGMSNNAIGDRGLSSVNYTTTEKWIMYQQKRKLLEEQNWSLKQRKTNERIAARFDKLKENVSSCEDISIRTRSVIELKKLQLLQVQRRLRSDFLHDFFKPITSDVERLKSFKKHRLGRRMKQLERLEQKMKEERMKRIRERQKEFFSEIEAHKEKMEDFFKVKRERWKGFNRYVKEFHKRKEKTHREKADRIQREKINLLKINDVEGYLRMVQDAKSDRVKQLLKATEKYLQKLGSKLQVAKAMATQFEMEMDESRAFNSLEKNEIAVDNEDAGDQAQHYLESNEKYYLMAHSIKESINEQPASLEGGKLREYQMNGLRWLVSLYNNNLNGILADEMGLGKTVQVISLMCYLMESKNDRGPFLVVVPSSVLPGWESEINFWAPSLAKVVYFGPPEVRRRLYREKIVHQKFNVILTTYEYLMNKNDRPKLSKIHWHYIIIDEGHRIKNASCKLNSDLKHYQSSHRLLLTGTPLQNNIDELWALLNFLLPNIFNSSEDFSQWFSKPFENSGDNSPDEALLSEEENLLIINRLHQVLRPFVLRRLKQKVANELPEKIERLVRCEASAYQKLLMKRVEDNLGSIGTSKGRSVHNSVMELRNICNHPYLSQLHTEEVHSLIPMHYLPPIVRLCGKLELLDRLLPKLKATDHRVLLFSTMTRLLDIMEEYLSWKGYRYLRLDGHTSGNERGALIEEFNKPDSPMFIFLLSIRAGGVGVNLQAADTVIIFDTDWNPQVDLQAQARAHRLGQKRDVLVLRLETVNTVEEQVRAAAEYKLGVANQSITAGFFDNNTSAEDRREYLESLLRECKKEEAALVLDDDALNDLIARSESEIDIFESVDKQRREEEMVAWKRLQERSKDGPLALPSRLVTDADLSEFYKVLEAYEASKVMEKRKTDVGELDTQLYGRGKRAREVRSYEDQWTEEEFEKLCQAESPEPPALKEVPKKVTDNPCASNDADESKLENIEAPKPPSKEPLPSPSEGPVPSSLKEPQPSSSKEPQPSSLKEPQPSSSKEPQPSSLKEPQASSSEAPPPASKEPLPLSSKEPLPSKEMPLPSIEVLPPSKETPLLSKELPEPSKESLLATSKDSVLLSSKGSVPQSSKELPLPPLKQCLPPPSEGSQLPSKEQLPPPSERPQLPSKEPLPINNESTLPARRGRGRPKRVPMDVSHSPGVLPMPSEAVNQLEIGSRGGILPGSDNASVHEVPSGNTRCQSIEAPGSQAYPGPAKSSAVKGQGRKTPGGLGKPRGRGKKQSSDSPAVASEVNPLSLLPNKINPVADSSPVIASAQDTERLLTRASNPPSVNFQVSPVSALQKPAELASLTQERQKSSACASEKMESKRAVPVLEVKASDTFEIKSAPSIDDLSLIAPQVQDNIKTNLIKSGREHGEEKRKSALPMQDRREKEQVFPIYDAKVPALGMKSSSTVHTSFVETKKTDSTWTNSTPAGQKMSHGQSPTASQEKQKSTFSDPGKRVSERMHPTSEARSAVFETKPSPSTSLMESKTHDGSKLSRMQADPERMIDNQITAVASTLAVDLLERQNLLMVPSERTPDAKLKGTGKPSFVPTSQKAVASLPSNAVLPRSSIGTGAHMELHMVKTVDVVVQQGNVHSEIAPNMSSEAMKNEALPVAVSMHQKQSSVDKSKKKPSARAKQGSERKASVLSSVQAVSEEKTACGSKQAALTGLDYLLGLETDNNDNTGKLLTTLDRQDSGTKQPITVNPMEGNLEIQHPVTVSVVKPAVSSEYGAKIGLGLDASMVKKKDPGLVVESAPHKETNEVKSVADAKLISEIQVINLQAMHSDQSVKDSVAVSLSQTLVGVSSEGQSRLGSRDNVVSLVNAPSSDSQQSEVKKECLSSESLGRRKDRGNVADSGKSKTISEGVRQTQRRRTRASSETMPSDTYPPIEKRVTRSAGKNARMLSKVNESESNEDRSLALHEPDKLSKEASLVRSVEMVSHMPMLSMPATTTPLCTEVVTNDQFVVSEVSTKPICIFGEDSHESSQTSEESMKTDNSLVVTCSNPGVTQEHDTPFTEPVSSDTLKPAKAESSCKDPVQSSKNSNQLANVNLQEDDHLKSCSSASNVSQEPKASKKESSSDKVEAKETDNSCTNAAKIFTDARQLKEISVKGEHVGLKHFVANAVPEGAAFFKKPLSSDQLKEALADDSCSIVTGEGNDSKQLGQEHTDCCMEASHPPGFGPLDDATCDKVSSVGVKASLSSDSCSSAIENRLDPTGFGQEMILTKVSVEKHASGSSAAEEFPCPEKPCSAVDVEVKAADPCLSAFTDDSTDLRQLTRQKDPKEGCTDVAISIDSVVQEEDASYRKLVASDEVKSASGNDSPVGMSTVPAVATPVMIEDGAGSEAKCVPQGPLTESSPINVIDGATFPIADSVRDSDQADSVLTDHSLAGIPCAVDLVDNLPTSETATGNSMSVTDAELAKELSILARESTESVIEGTDCPAQKHIEENATHTKTSNVSIPSCSESVTAPSHENAVELKQAMLIPNSTEVDIACENANKTDDGQSAELCPLDTSQMFMTSSQAIHSDKYVTNPANVDVAVIDNVSSETPLKTDFSIEERHAEYPKVPSIAVGQDGDLGCLTHGENPNLSTISLELATQSKEMDGNTDLPPDVGSELNTEQDGREDDGSHISASCATALASDLYTEEDVKADDSAFDCSKAFGVVVSVENIPKENKMVDSAVGPSVAIVVLAPDKNTKHGSDLLEAACDGSGVLDASVSEIVLPSIASEHSCSREDPAHPVPGAIVDKEDSTSCCNQEPSLLGGEQLTKKAADSSMDHAAVISNLSNNNNPVDVSSAGKQGKEPPVGHMLVSMTSMTMASNKDIEQDDSLFAATCISSKSKDPGPPEPEHPSLAGESCNPGPILEDCQECPVLGDIESEETCTDSCNKESELVEIQTQSEDIPADSDSQVGGTSTLPSMDEDFPMDASRVVAEEKDESLGKIGLSLTPSLREVDKADTFSGNIIKSDVPLQIPLVSDGEKDADNPLRIPLVSDGEKDADNPLQIPLVSDGDEMAADQPASPLLKEKEGQVEDLYGTESMVIMSYQDSVYIPPVQNEGGETSMQKTSLSSSSSLREEEKFDGRPEEVSNSDEPMDVTFEETKDTEPPIENSDFSSSLTSRKEDGKVDAMSENDPAVDNQKADPVDILLSDSKENISSEGNQGTSLLAKMRKEDEKVDGTSVEDSKLYTESKEPTETSTDVAEGKPVPTGSVDVSKVFAEEKEASMGIACSFLSPPLGSDYAGESEKVCMEMDIHLASDKGKATPEDHTDLYLSPSREECKVDDRPKEDCKIGFEEKDLSAGHPDSSLPLALGLDDVKVNNPSIGTNLDEQNATSGVGVGEQGPSTGILASSLTPALREENEVANDASVTDSEGTFHTSEPVVISSGGKGTTGRHTEPFLPPLREEDHKVNDMSDENVEVFSEEMEVCKRHASLSLIPCLKAEADIEGTSEYDSVPSDGPESPMNIQLSGDEEKRASAGTEELSSTLMQKDDKVIGNTCEVNCMVGPEEKETSEGNSNLLLDHYEKVEDVNIRNPSNDLLASIAPRDPINVQLTGAEEKEASMGTEDLPASSSKGDYEIVNGEASKNSRLDMNDDDLMSMLQTGGGGEESLAGILEPSASPSLTIGDKAVNNTPENIFKLCTTSDDPLGIPLVHVETFAGNAEPSSCHEQGKDFKVESKSDKNFEFGSREKDESTRNEDWSSSLPQRMEDEEVNGASNKDSLRSTDSDGSLETSNARIEREVTPTGNADSSLHPILKGEDCKVDGPSGKNSKVDNDSSIQVGVLGVRAGEKATTDIDGSTKMFSTDTTGSDQLDFSSTGAGTMALSRVKDVSCSHSLDEEEKYNDLSGKDPSIIIRSDDSIDVPKLESKEVPEGNADLAASPILTAECEKADGFSGEDSIQNIYTDDPTGMPVVESEIEEGSAGNADSLVSQMVEDEKIVGTFGKDSMVTINSNNQMCTLQTGAEENEASSANADPSLPSSMEDKNVGSSFGSDSDVIISSDDPVDTSQAASRVKEKITENVVSLPSLPSRAEGEVVCSLLCEDSNLIVNSNDSVGVLRAGAEEIELPPKNAYLTVPTSSIEEDKKIDDSTDAPAGGAEEKTEVSTINSSLPTSTSGTEENEKLCGGMSTGKTDQSSSSTVKEDDFKDDGLTVEGFKVDTSSGYLMNTIQTGAEDKVSLKGHEDPLFPLTTRDEDLEVDDQSREGSAVSTKSEDLMDVPPSGSKEIEISTRYAVLSSFPSKNEGMKVIALATKNSMMTTDSDDPIITSQVTSDEKEKLVGNASSSSSREEAPKADAASEQSSVENKNPADQMAISQGAALDIVTVVVNMGSPSLSKDEVDDGCGKDPSAINSSEPVDVAGASVQGKETLAQEAADEKSSQQEECKEY